MSAIYTTHTAVTPHPGRAAQLNTWLARIVIAGVVYAIAALIGIHLLRPDFDPWSRFVSEYAAGPFGYLVSSAFYTLSLASAALVISLYRATAPVGRARVGQFFLGFWSVAALLAGIFPADPAGTGETPAGLLHTQAEMFGLGALVFGSLIVLDRWRHDLRWVSLIRPALIPALIAMAGAQWIILAFTVGGPELAPALAQRGLLAGSLVWILLVGWRLHRIATGSLAHEGVETAPSAMAEIPQSVVWLARLALLGVGYVVVTYIFLNVVRTDYNPLERFMSEYIYGPYGALMTSTFYVMALASAALLLGFYRAVAPVGRSWLGLVLLAVFSLGFLVAGIFPTDQRGGPFTLSGALHGIGGNLVFPNILIASLVLADSWRHDRRWAAITRPALFLGIVVVTAFVFTMFCPPELNGLGQRWFLAGVFGWQILAAWRLQRLATDKTAIR
jgi:hypothetical protein